MNKYNKILIIGNCGSGKSTLSSKLSAILNIPIIHLDKYFWKPKWQPTPSEEWKQTIGQLIQKDKWIIDGNYFNTLESRIKKADLIIFLDVKPITCFFRVLIRTFLQKERPDMLKGYVDRFDLKFYKYILTYNMIMKPKILELLDRYKQVDQIIGKTNVDEIIKCINQ